MGFAYVTFIIDERILQKIEKQKDCIHFYRSKRFFVLDICRRLYFAFIFNCLLQRNVCTHTAGRGAKPTTSVRKEDKKKMRNKRNRIERRKKQKQNKTITSLKKLFLPNVFILLARCFNGAHEYILYIIYTIYKSNSWTDFG